MLQSEDEDKVEYYRQLLNENYVVMVKLDESLDESTFEEKKTMLSQLVAHILLYRFVSVIVLGFKEGFRIIILLNF